jgi:4-amino-4-deoxy-L-arabinose transferase-like glycosyltransferase
VPGVQARSRPFWIWLSVACAGGLALRLSYVFVVKAHFVLWGDAFYYNRQASLLAAGKGFIEPFKYVYGHQSVAAADHPPLLPIVLAVSDKIGLSSLTSHKVIICLIGVLTIAVVALVARRLAGDRAGIIAALLGALYPGFWIHDGQILAEPLAMLAVAVAVLLAYRFWSRPGPALAIGVGVACGLAALTRSELVLLVPLLAAPLALLARDRSLRRRLGLAGLAVLAALVTMAPWLVRNTVTFKHPVYLSSQFDPTLTVANCDNTYYGQSVGSWYFYCGANLHPPPGDESVADQYYRHVATTYIGQHLSRLPVVALARVGRTWGLYQPIGQTHIDTIDGYELTVNEIHLYSYYALAVGAVAGAVILRRRRVPILPLVSVVVAVTIGVIVTYGSTRFRAPGEVAIVALAAVGADALLSLRRSSRAPDTAGEQVDDAGAVLEPAVSGGDPTEVSS